jgi:hypothetical protein
MTTIINAAGGDYQGLPTTPVQYRGATKHAGLPWNRITEEYVARGGRVDDTVWPGHNGKVVVIAGNARSSGRNLHTFVEHDDYEEPAYTEPATAPMRVTRPKRPSTPGKLTLEQRAEIGRRYKDHESLTTLAKAYGVTVTTISKTIARQGIEARRPGLPS